MVCVHTPRQLADRRISSLAAGLAAALVLSLAPSPASANPERLLRQAEKAYEQLEYIAALKTLLKVQQAKGVTAIQRARAYLYMGVCFTALGKAENAVQAFMEVVKLRPRFRLPPGVSPSIRTMFAEALKRLKLPLVPPPKKREPPKKHVPAKAKTVDVLAKGPLEAVAGKPLSIKIDIEDPSKRIERIEVKWRRIGGPDYSVIKLAYKGKKASLEAMIPISAVGGKPGRLAYYVVAKDAAGRTIAHSGSDDEPFEVTLEEPPKKTSNWGWWTLGIVSGAAVIAGGIVAAVLLTQNKGTPNNPPGTAGVVVIIE